MKNLIMRVLLYPLLTIKIVGHGLMITSDFMQDKLGSFLKDRE